MTQKNIKPNLILTSLDLRLFINKTVSFEQNRYIKKFKNAEELIDGLHK